MKFIKPISTSNHRVYHIETANLSRDGKSSLIAACFDGNILAINTDGEILWNTETGGFPFDIYSYDIDGDGKEEILVASADYKLYAISSEGKILWTYKTQGPLYQTTAGCLDGKNPLIFCGGIDHHIYMLSPDGKLLLKRKVPKSSFSKSAQDDEIISLPGAVRRLRCARLNGKDQLITDSAARMGHVDIFGLEGPELRETWHQRIEPFEDCSYEASGKMDRKAWRANDMITDDINGDGNDLIIIGSGSISGTAPDDIVVCDNNGKIINVSHNEEEENRNDHNYRALTPAVGLLEGVDGKVIFSVSGPRVMAFDKTLTKLFDLKAPISFTDICPVTENGHSILYLSVLGDNTVYRIDPRSGWEDEFTRIPQHGIAAEISNTLISISNQVMNFPESSSNRNKKKEPYIVEIAAVFMTKAKFGHMQHYIDHYHWVREQIPYDNLKLVTVFWLSEQGMELSPKGKKWVLDKRMGYDFTQKELLDIAQRFENEGVPFMIQNSHGCGGFLSLDTIEKMLKIAPETFQGLIGSETNHYDLLEEFAEDYLIPEMRLLAKYGNKKMVLREGSQFWPIILATPKYYDIFFNGEFKDTLVPCAEEAASYNGELHVAARHGMWINGLVNTWGTRVIGDQLRVNPAFTWDTIMCGHPYLRLLISHTALGAGFFMFHHGMDNASGEPSFTPTGEDFFWTTVGKESSFLFLHMLGKGVISPPGRKQIAGTSEVALALNPLSERLLHDMSLGHNYDEVDISRSEARYVISKFNSWYALTNAFETDAASYLYGKTKHYLNLIPNTKYGMVPIVSNIDQESSPFAKKFVTDGDKFLIDEKPMSPETAKPVIIKELEKRRSNLPFVSNDDIFMQVIQNHKENSYHLILVDQDIIEPRDREVTINNQTGKKIFVTDILTKEEIPAKTKNFKITVPAGAFKILSVITQT